jgi:signal transduction histidine kinase
MEYSSTTLPDKCHKYILPVKTLQIFIPIVIMMLCSLSCPGQNGWASAQDWQNILAQHKTKKLHDTLYLLKAQALTEQSFKDPTLKEKLSAYRKIAWSNNAYRPFRVKYYAFLANHATFLHQEGFAIYYLQKMEEELQKIEPYVNSLNQPRLLLAIYGRNDLTNQSKRINIINGVMPFLRSLPEKLSKQSVSINTCINAFTILKHSSQLNQIRKDTVRAFEAVNLSRKIWSELEKKKGLDQGKLEQCRLSLYLIECAASGVLAQKDKEREILNKAYSTIISKNNHIAPEFKNTFERTILGRLIDYHIEQNQADSANYYFAKFKNKVDFYKKTETGDGIKFLLYAGKVHAQNRAYKTAYQNVLRAYEMNDSIISIKTADIHNNMYAHLVAEQSNDALVIAEQQKKDGNLVISMIAILLITITGLFVWGLKVNRSKARKQIEELNKITHIQIAELEANTNLIQKKMGMELHDDIAGRLVNICNFIETQTLDEKNPERSRTLKTIGEMARDAYTNTRLKSHDWYFKGIEEERIGFSQRVFKIVDQALPDGKYEKQIEIDDESLEKVSPEMRIHLLRIIQEAVTNILKHAKASKVKLFLYGEDGSITLQITDNGKGFDVRAKSKGLGLQSLKNRINEMNGSVEITSPGQGTELLFTAPLHPN